MEMTLLSDLHGIIIGSICCYKQVNVLGHFIRDPMANYLRKKYIRDLCPKN